MREQLDAKLVVLRRTINEGLRTQLGGASGIPYIGVGSVLPDIVTRQNHVIFGRRGCGKTLLLHQLAKEVGDDITCVYLNCEDFKNHSFPNVIIEILDELFKNLEQYLTGRFIQKRKARKLIKSIRNELSDLKAKADQQEKEIRTLETRQDGMESSAEAEGAIPLNRIRGRVSRNQAYRSEVEQKYRLLEEKSRALHTSLPTLKKQIREFISTSANIETIFLQVDDFYHLTRQDQPHVIDYIHRLCKDLPLFFKLATLRHASSLYVDRLGQPIGVQQRNDYQPIDIDFTLADLPRTQEQNRRILHEYGRISEMTSSEIDNSLFKGEGFERLVLAGGGVPRDFLSLFLEVLESVRSNAEDRRIGKDDVRHLSRSNFQRRIEELKEDSAGSEQSELMQGIFILQRFCIDDSESNIFMISEQEMQQKNFGRDMINRLLDYRIIHSCGSALTHKSQPGSYQAFAIDIGCYAHMRVLRGRLNEIDLLGGDAKERMRSAPIFDIGKFEMPNIEIPQDLEAALLDERS